MRTLREVILFQYAEFLLISVMGLRGKALVAGGCRGDFCEKLQEASPLSDKASGRWL